MAGLKRTVLGVVIGSGILGLAAGGCVSYTNVPVPSSAPAFKHANSGASIKSISAAIERVVLRHPMKDAQGRYAVNLPAGTTPETAEKILDRLSDGAVIPWEGMDESVPVYHISRIWLRGATGKVDVVYPIDADTDGGVTAWVQGGDRSWYVERLQYWAPGTIPTPPVYVPIGDTERRGEMMTDDEYEAPVDMDELESAPESPAVDESVRERAAEPEPDDQVLYREIDD
ncbi:MAG: hypothetical protein JJ974_00690 [Phycisphaerales bacterium]|nr:hypothetical protein [Phycisphaerales bacterium]